MLLRCCLIHISIIIARHFLYLIYVCPFLSLGQFMSYLCNLVVIVSLIFSVINHITSLKLTHLFFAQFLECLLLFRAVERSPKCIRKKPARQFKRIWETLIGTVAMIYSKLVSLYLFNFLYDTCFMSRMIHVLLCYAVQGIFEYYPSTHAKRGVV